MLSGILAIVGGFFKAIAAWLGLKRDQTMRQAGRDEVRVEQGQQGLEAHKRMDQAAAKPHDDAATEKNLRDGKF